LAAGRRSYHSAPKHHFTKTITAVTSDGQAKFYGQEKREEYALAIGKVIWAWAEYHEMLAELYATLSGKEKWSKSLDDWHAEKDDHRARQRLLKAAKDGLPVTDRALDAIKWIVKTTDDILRGNRNIAAHMPLMSFADEHGTHQILPMTILGNPRAIEMAGRDVLAEYARFETQILEMKTYAMGIGIKLSQSFNQWWPERPTF
jgi:hypothetical protein